MKDKYKFVIAVLIIIGLTAGIEAATNIYTNGIATAQLNATSSDGTASINANRNLASGSTSEAVINAKNQNVGDDQVVVYSEQAAPAISIHSVALNVNGTGGYFVDHSRLISGNYVYLAGGNDAQRRTIYAYRNLNSSHTGDAVITGYQANTTDDQPVFKAVNYGTGAVQEWWNSTDRMAYVHENGTFYSNGGFVDATPSLQGNPLDVIKTHKGKDGRIDDENLHEFMKAIWDVPITETQVIDEKEVLVVTGYTQKAGRNIGNSLTVCIDSINALMVELCNKDNSYGFC